MNACFRLTSQCIVVMLFVGVARAQENANGERVVPAPPGVDKYYWDLAKSEDRVLRSHVERYVGLVKIQEWSDQSGKFKAIGHYVKHDPQLKTVTIKVFRGRGAERTSDDKTVPVDKLSPQCQSRVKQIDIAQKKIKEMATKLAKDGNAPAAEPPSETATSPTTEVRGPGAAPGPGAGAEPGAVAATPAVPEPDPSAAEPDPLGFAEVPISTTDAPRGPGETPPEETTPPPARK